jgi:hypothetical protein
MKTAIRDKMKGFKYRRTGSNKPYLRLIRSLNVKIRYQKIVHKTSRGNNCLMLFSAVWGEGGTTVFIPFVRIFIEHNRE